MSARLNYDVVKHVLKHMAADPDLTRYHAKELFKTAVHYRMNCIKKIIVLRIDACSPKKAAEKGQIDLLEWWRTSGKLVHWDSVMIHMGIVGHVSVLDWVLDHDLLQEKYFYIATINFDVALVSGPIRVFEWLDKAGLLCLCTTVEGTILDDHMDLLKWCHGHELFHERCSWDEITWLAVDCISNSPHDEEIVEMFEWIATCTSGDGYDVYPKIVPSALCYNHVHIIKWLHDKKIRVRWGDLDWEDLPLQLRLKVFLKHPKQTFVFWDTIAEEYQDDKEAIGKIIHAGAQVDWDYVAAKHLDVDDGPVLKVLVLAGAQVDWDYLMDKYLLWDNDIALKAMDHAGARVNWDNLVAGYLDNNLMLEILAHWIADQL
ncbi:hypothetical protein AMAG_08989 [Allomyces macrogynus ATCC 38327]|uniref:Ankyrin repeat protein n=1 Tax=Allomyces macrogynus (strain ATCC 38327) TaxID=578462 RepID=A0A0L0SN13_ALLM3|nr:hypothetical protein AMAG_08989 [Allomyces macrogynus ATCC 38327]|eukprot:KNE63931.1 hypothetical protein AMAG_08989 [Allomyces macrogynus ATCC 38327]